MLPKLYIILFHDTRPDPLQVFCFAKGASLHRHRLDESSPKHVPPGTYVSLGEFGVFFHRFIVHSPPHRLRRLHLAGGVLAKSLRQRSAQRAATPRQQPQPLILRIRQIHRHLFSSALIVRLFRSAPLRHDGTLLIDTAVLYTFLQGVKITNLFCGKLILGEWRRIIYFAPFFPADESKGVIRIKDRSMLFVLIVTSRKALSLLGFLAMGPIFWGEE